MIKCYGDIEHPNDKAMLENVKDGNSIIIETSSNYYST